MRGEGIVDMHVAALPLLAGRYLLSAAVYDKTMLHPYDHHDRLYHFAVHNECFVMLDFVLLQPDTDA